MERSQAKVYPWRRRRRRLLWGIFLLAMAGILAILLLSWRNRMKFEDQIESIRQAGFPATVEELNRSYPEPLPDQNAAEVYQKSFEAQQEPSTAPGYKDISERLKKVTNTLGEELLGQMEAYLAENAEALRLLHEAAKYPACRYPVDFSKGYDMDMSYLPQLRHAVRLLNLEALVAAARGQPDQALDSILAALAAIDSIREEPIIISQLIGIAMRDNTTDTVRRLLEMETFSEAQLAQLGPVLSHSYDPEALTRALAGERVCGLSGYGRPRQLFEQFADLDRYMPGANSIVAGLANLTGALNNDREYYLETMDTMIEASRQPIYKALPELQGVQNSVDANRTWLPRFSDGLLPAITRMQYTHARGQADIENTVTAIAIERYRDVYGRLPERIEYLVPSFLESVPVDPFDGRPLRYLPNGNGYTVYSIGENLRDDGAAELSSGQNTYREGDWVFRVNRGP